MHRWRFRSMQQPGWCLVETKGHVLCTADAANPALAANTATAVTPTTGNPVEGRSCRRHRVRRRVQRTRRHVLQRCGDRWPARHVADDHRGDAGGGDKRWRLMQHFPREMRHGRNSARLVRIHLLLLRHSAGAGELRSVAPGRQTLQKERRHPRAHLSMHEHPLAVTADVAAFLTYVGRSTQRSIPGRLRDQ